MPFKNNPPGCGCGCGSTTPSTPCLPCPIPRVSLRLEWAYRRPGTTGVTGTISTVFAWYPGQVDQQNGIYGNFSTRPATWASPGPTTGNLGGNCGWWRGQIYCDGNRITVQVRSGSRNPPDWGAGQPGCPTGGLAGSTVLANLATGPNPSSCEPFAIVFPDSGNGLFAGGVLTIA